MCIRDRPRDDQQEQYKEQQTADVSRPVIDQVVRRGSLRMATCRLSSIGNSIQPIREEPSFDERHADGELSLIHI